MENARQIRLRYLRFCASVMTYVTFEWRAQGTHEILVCQIPVRWHHTSHYKLYLQCWVRVRLCKTTKEPDVSCQYGKAFLREGAPVTLVCYFHMTWILRVFTSINHPKLPFQFACTILRTLFLYSDVVILYFRRIRVEMLRFVVWSRLHCDRKWRK